MANKYLDEAPSMSLLKGVIWLLAGAISFFIIAVVVVMTPDPEFKINYGLVLIIEGILIGVTLYGTMKLEQLNKFLQLCERTTLCYTKNSKDEKKLQSGPSSTQRPQQEK